MRSIATTRSLIARFSHSSLFASACPILAVHAVSSHGAGTLCRGDGVLGLCCMSVQEPPRSLQSSLET